MTRNSFDSECIYCREKFVVLIGNIPVCPKSGLSIEAKPIKFEKIQTRLLESTSIIVELSKERAS
ncbi:hypothetical protein A3A76_00600 [Candidatus Woesebacteria bacterium RIFCSPLOWO2_01_FULL_39_23]|uniref:Spt4/RpoE2 zinc finger domain-containing protein n=1 Tax=Candidatus Woesebacteria bacterium RIFCSPHIGHO2_01_FULL_40_22 TaxID=1802499 RepID=A0A1F7YIT7_9BACT|nr:MAG: hypothetical protein A2141_05785 [Candidatus Woesebacteria bacterium RBG_16_40_11]OGM27193.1 MAG: hypothetical protein A2628_04115 [Candidatus Woesebacteria bacterium RIFCSPHIGHO2_01_FULL_40_22]OGM36929.1 MAG: hypothetical protein A3E41_05165 [Candidatus Woesebacteria bacterium RIFCSPHIGHO2_12_FULL_38_9]OGM63359.1 MAG: hypothetical protein A3A76_00600 [Candidatus Woesebacteria bacterium RIFCSPLOWO2_01_FULL_39_23]